MRLFELASPESEDRFAELLRKSTKSSIVGKPQLYVPRPVGGYGEGSAPMPAADQRFDPKPGDRKPETGFWTSTATEVADGWESAWSKWVIGEMPGWYSEVGTLFYPVPGAKILTMNTDQDYQEVYNLYTDLTHAKHPDEPNDMGAMKIHKNFPWPWVAHHFDAVHTENPSSWGLHMAGWDVESTVWFNLDALQKLGKVSVSNGGRDTSDYEEEDWDDGDEEQEEDDFWAERGVG
jgi:hypothetical protein